MDESLEPGTYIPFFSPPSLALLHLRFIIPAFFIHPHLQSSWLLRLSRIYNTSNTERVGEKHMSLTTPTLATENERLEVLGHRRHSQHFRNARLKSKRTDMVLPP